MSLVIIYIMKIVVVLCIDITDISKVSNGKFLDNKVWHICQDTYVINGRLLVC